MAANDDKKEVFISYCTKDQDLVDYFCNLIEGSGIKCWIASRDIPKGSNWADSIMNGLENSHIIAFMVSSASVASKEVEKEIGLAASNFKDKEVLQVRLENAPLPRGLVYHLASKQWVDALEGDKSTRFTEALDAIRNILPTTNVNEDADVADDSIIGQSRALLEQIKSKHASTLAELNIPLSLQVRGGNSVFIILPIRFGATGQDLIMKFCWDNSIGKIHFYTDALVSGDTTTEPFFNCFLNNRFIHYFPTRRLNKYKYECTTLIPETVIPSPLISPEDAFTVFKSHMLRMSEDVFPALFKWAMYGRSVCNAIDSLINKLNAIFPASDSDKWLVGAPEGYRLSDCRKEGSITVYKDSWRPASNDYKHRGWLSFSLYSNNNLISDLRIGIVKYESWHDLGQHGELLFSKCKELFGERVSSDQNWVCYIPLDTPWNDSGIGQAESTWKGKLEEFEKYCIDKFNLLKQLETEVDAANRDIPALQDKDPFEYQQGKQTIDFRTDHLYVRNRLRLIADKAKTDPEVQIDYHYFSHEWTPKLLIFKLYNVNYFQTFLAVGFQPNLINTVAFSESQINLETTVLKQFLDFHHKDAAELMNSKIQPAQNFAGKTPVEWLDMVDDYVTERIGAYTTALKGFKTHLTNVVELTRHVENAIKRCLPDNDDWIIDNKASSLEQNKPISIWRSSWRKNGAKDDDLPPLVLQIIPTKPCFESLIISLGVNESIATAFDQRLGMVCGACEFAFGKEHEPAGRHGIWSAPLPKYAVTGGSSFDRPLISGDKLMGFEEYLKEFVNSVMRMDDIITPLCRDHNEQVHFIGGMNSLIDELTKSIVDIFPAKDGWKITSNAKTLERWASIRIFKETWKRTGLDSGKLTIAIEAGQANFDDLYYGIIDLGLFTNEEKEVLRKQINDHKDLCYGRQSNAWPWYKYAEGSARLTGGREKKVIDEKAQDEMHKFFKGKLSTIKTDIVPTIENILRSDSKKD